MKHKLLFAALLTIMITGCYLPLGGRVIDAETNEPIEGAFVLALWTKTHGSGPAGSAVHKIAETETGKQGEFTLPGAYSPFVQKPRLVIYKQGYIGWRNDLIYTAAKKEDGSIVNRTIARTDYDVWQDDHVYPLKRFEEGYPRLSHFSFLGRGVLGALEKRETSKFKDAITSELKAAAAEQEKPGQRP